MFDGFFDGLFGDPGFKEPTRLDLGDDAVSDLLPYRVFDPEQGLYHNDKTTGFIFEITPVIDADETAGALHGALVAACPSEAGVQFISWASPNVDHRLRAWARAKSHGGEVMERMATRRVDHIMNMRFGSQHSIKSIPNDRRVFVSAWIEGDTGMAAVMAPRSSISFARAAIPVSPSTQALTKTRRSFGIDLMLCFDPKRIAMM